MFNAKDTVLLIEQVATKLGGKKIGQAEKTLKNLRLIFSTMLQRVPPKELASDEPKAETPKSPKPSNEHVIDYM